MGALSRTASPADFLDTWAPTFRFDRLKYRAELKPSSLVGFAELFDALFERFKGSLRVIDSCLYADFASFCLRHDIREVEQEVVSRVYARAALDTEFDLDDLCDHISLIDFEKMKADLLTHLQPDVVAEMKVKILDEEVNLQ